MPSVLYLMWIPIVLMVLFWIGIIALTIYIVNKVTSKPDGAASAGQREAERVLKERYVRGEVSRDEYRAMLDDIRQ